MKTVEYKQKLKDEKYNAREILSDMTSVGGRQIQRYVRLTNLIPSLMRLVDEGKLAISPAVELSYLNGQQQEHIVNAMQQIWADDSRIADPNVTYAQAKILHNLSKEGELNVDSVIDVLSQPKPNQKERLTIPMDDIRPYMPQGYTDRQCMQYLIKLAKCEYQRQLEIYKKSQKNKKEIGER